LQIQYKYLNIKIKIISLNERDSDHSRKRTSKIKHDTPQFTVNVSSVFRPYRPNSNA